MVGASPDERIMIDSNLLLKIAVSRKEKELYERSETIMIDFLRKCTKVFRLVNRLDAVKDKGFYNFILQKKN